MCQSLRVKNCVAILEVFVAYLVYCSLFRVPPPALCSLVTKLRHTGVHSKSDRPSVRVICEAIIFLVDTISNQVFRRVRKISKSDC